MKRVAVCAIVLCVVAVAGLGADIKTQQKNQVKFAGTLGSVINVFGGKATHEGVVETITVSGDRKMTVADNTAQIIDLAEEKVYDLDLKAKTYKVTTFDEIRRKMQEARDRAQKNAERSEPRKDEKAGKPEKEWQVDVDVKNTGQRKTINGFDCRNVITTITAHEKGKTLQQSGGMVLTADSWLAPKIPAMKEVLDFDIRYAQKLTGIDPAVSAEQMAAAMAMYPGLKEAMAKMQSSNATLDGTAIMTTATFDGVKSAEEAAKANEQKSNEDQPTDTSVGSMLSGFGKRFAKKKEEANASKDPNRATFMTMNHEVMSVSTSVDPASLAIPAGFRQK